MQIQYIELQDKYEKKCVVNLTHVKVISPNEDTGGISVLFIDGTAAGYIDCYDDVKQRLRHETLNRGVDT